MGQMIGLISGSIVGKDRKRLLIETASLGYWVNVSNKTFIKFAEGDNVKLFIYHHLREGVEELFGLETIEDFKTFESLLKVSGIGPKIASSVFDAGSGDEIWSAIASGNVNFFTSVPGIGKKNATKMVFELKGKGVDLSAVEDIGNDDLLKALKSMGYTNSELKNISAKVTGSTLEEQVLSALRVLGS